MLNSNGNTAALYAALAAIDTSDPAAAQAALKMALTAYGAADLYGLRDLLLAGTAMRPAVLLHDLRGSPGADPSGGTGADPGLTGLADGTLIAAPSSGRTKPMHTNDKDRGSVDWQQALRDDDNAAPEMIPA